MGDRDPGDEDDLKLQCHGCWRWWRAIPVGNGGVYAVCFCGPRDLQGFPTILYGITQLVITGTVSV